MDTKFLVHFSGSTPGLDEHRLSLGLFGDALDRMLTALRRLASNLIKQAQDDDDGGSLSGRLAKEAQAIDLEISSIEKGSVGLGLAVVARLAFSQGEMFETLPDRACTEFIKAVELESQGKARSAPVRAYLQALPAGIAVQRYQLRRSDGSAVEAEVQSMDLTKLPPTPPRMVEVIGPIIGVGFEPGKWEVRLLDPLTKRPITCAATKEQVADAIELRSQSARAFLVTTGGKTRLLRIQSSDQPPVHLSEEEREALVFDRWDDLLRRFAQ